MNDTLNGMVDPSLALPVPTPEDGEDVVLALETAATLWKRGDTQDAIRWLRRAAESAEEAGNDTRALALARTAADLSSGTERKAPRPPSDRPLPARTGDIDPSVAAALQVRTGPRSFPTPPPPPSVSRPPPPSASRPPPPANASPESRAVPPAADRLPSAPQASGPAPTPKSAPAAAPAPAKAPRSPATDALSELMRADGAPVKTNRATSPTALGALRVSVRRSPEDPRLLVARLLGPEESAPKGEKNAILVATEIILEQLLPAE